MTCGTCKHHLHDETNQQDRNMAALNYKLCSKSEDQLRQCRYLHVNAKACRMYKSVAESGKL